VRHEHRRTDIIEQRRATASPQLPRDGVVRHRLVHRRDHLRDVRIVHALLQLARDLLECRRLPVEQAVYERLERIASLSRPIDDVDRVALGDELGHPAAAAIGRAQPVAALAVAAVNQNDRIGMPDLGGNPVLDEHLRAVDHRSARELRALDAVPEVAPVGDVEHRAWCGLRARAQRNRCGSDGSGSETSKFAASQWHTAHLKS